MISHSRLLELLDYDPTTGVFTRKVTLSNKNKIGDVAGNLNRGYIELSVDGRVYRAHRLAWFYVHGVWPNDGLDHKDLDKKNNAIGNLREATQSQNGVNNGVRKNNTLGVKGVSKHGDRFKASVMVKRKRLHIGIFDTAHEAARAYDNSAIQHFGEFALTNQQLGVI